MPITDPERLREYRRRWNVLHRAEYQRKYREAHPLRPEQSEGAKLAKRFAKRQRYLARRAAVMELLGGAICVRCGFSDIRALQIDHINGGGLRHVRTFPSYATYLQAILDTGGVGFQVLCANCNQIKKIEQGEH